MVTSVCPSRAQFTHPAGILKPYRHVCHSSKQVWEAVQMQNLKRACRVVAYARNFDSRQLANSNNNHIHFYILIRIPDFNMMSINFSAKLVTRRKLVRHLSSLRPESNQDFSDTCVGPVKSNEFQYLQQSIVHTSAFQRSLPR